MEAIFTINSDDEISNEEISDEENDDEEEIDFKFNDGVGILFEVRSVILTIEFTECACRTVY
jgi:hypothetical protein